MLRAVMKMKKIAATSRTESAAASFAVMVFPPFEPAAMTKEAIIGQCAENGDDAEILSHGTITLGGAPCAVFDILRTGDGHETARELICMANRGGKGYTLVFSAAALDYGKFEDSFKMILDSFNF